MIRSAGRIATAVASISLAALVTVGLGAGSAAAAPSHRATRATDPVTLTVTSVSPSVPTASSTSQPLTVTVSAHNTSTEQLDATSLDLVRGDPVGSAAALAATLQNPVSAAGGLGVAGTSPSVDLSPGQTRTLTFRTTMSTVNDERHLCLCAEHEVYPLILSLRSASAAGTVLGQVRTFLPVFDTTPAHKTQAAWLWPIIDRPHRLASGTVFTDESLADSAADGRLDRLLDVAEQVADENVPITLLVDPELLDELEIMATQPYTVQTGTSDGTVSAAQSSSAGTTGSGTRAPSGDLSSGDTSSGDTSSGNTSSAGTSTSVTGSTGSASGAAGSGSATANPSSSGSEGATLTVRGRDQKAAAGWLARFRTLLISNPSTVDVQLTPYGDPDVTRLSVREQSWFMSPPTTTSVNRVRSALAGRSLQHTIAWPSGTTSSLGTLRTLARDGVQGTILSSTALTVADSSSAGGQSPTVPPAATQVRLTRSSGTSQPSSTSTSPGVMPVTVIPADQLSAAAAAVTGSLGELPVLEASLAARAAGDLAARAAGGPGTAQRAVLAPSRYVDPDVSAAVTTIVGTSRNAFTTPTTVSTVTGAASETTSTLRAFRPSSANLSDTAISSIAAATGSLAAVRSLIGSTTPGRQTVTDLAVAVQLLESASGSKAGLPINGPTQNRSLAISTADRMGALLSGVQILVPSSGSYTLTSNTSPLPVTIRNDTPYDAVAHISVPAVTGFSARPPAAIRIPAQSKETVRIPARVQRSGRIQVVVSLSTVGTDTSLGVPVRLTIHSTALGTIGVVITVVAGVVLFLALLVRYIRRVQRIRRKRHRADPPAGAPGSPDPADRRSHPPTGPAGAGRAVAASRETGP